MFRFTTVRAHFAKSMLHFTTVRAHFAKSMLRFTTARAHFAKSMLRFTAARAHFAKSMLRFTMALPTCQNQCHVLQEHAPHSVQGAVQVAPTAPRGAPGASLRAFPATLSLLHINVYARELRARGLAALRLTAVQPPLCLA